MRRVINLAFPFSDAKTRIAQLFGATASAPASTLSALQSEMISRRRESESLNEKTRNYHYYEYNRGEDFIENIPINDANKYTIRDEFGEREDNERRTVEELQPVMNHEAMAKLIRDRINNYHEKQKKY